MTIQDLIDVLAAYRNKHGNLIVQGYGNSMDYSLNVVSVEMSPGTDEECLLDTSRVNLTFIYDEDEYREAIGEPEENCDELDDEIDYFDKHPYEPIW